MKLCKKEIVVWHINRVWSHELRHSGGGTTFYLDNVWKAIELGMGVINNHKTARGWMEFVK